MLQRHRFASLLFASPALAIYTLIVIYPALSGALLSFTNSAGGAQADFVGLANFELVAKDPRVLPAFAVTIEYALLSVVLGNAVGLFLARALYYRPRIRKIGTILVLLPTLVAAVMAAFVFSYIFSPTGALNTALTALGLGSLAQPWLGNPDTALFAVVAVSVWTGTGSSALIFLSSFLNLDGELLDAGAIDGVSGWKKFIYLEWPLVSPALTVNLTLGTIGALRVFELPLVLTNGGPVNATTSVSMIIYSELFGQGNYGFAYSTALSVVLLLIVVIIASVLTSVTRWRERRMFA